MTDRSLSEVSFATVWAGHRASILSSILVCATTGAAITPLLPNRYAAHMEILVRNERDQYLISPNQAATSSLPNAVSEEEVNSEIELMQSQDLLQRVAIGSKLYPGPFRGGLPSDPKLLDRTIVKLRNSLDVSAIRKSNIIRATIKAEKPERASEILTNLLHEYMVEEVNAHASPKSFKFFTAQLATDGERLQEASTVLSAFREENLLFDSDQQRTALVTELVNVSAKLMNTNSEINEQKSRQQATMAERDHADPRMSTQVKSVVNQALVERLQGELTDLENRKIDLLVKFKSDDRVVASVSEQIANLKRDLASAYSSPTEEKQSDANPLHLSLVGDLSRGRIELRSLTARYAALETEKASYLTQLDKLDKDTIHLNELVRTEQDAERNYAATQRQLEEARVSEQMDQQQIVNVALVENPAASPLPVSPSIKFDLALGAFCGMLIGFLWGYVSDVKTRRKLLREENKNPTADQSKTPSSLM